MVIRKLFKQFWAVGIMVKSKKKGSSDDDEPGGRDIQKDFDEEMKKPYYIVSYLDNFKLPYEKLDVSIIIPTYNRCPFKPDTMKEENNPLSWCLDSAILQKPSVNEIVVVDDCSTDYTSQIFESYKSKAEKAGITLKYIKNKKNLGYSESINIGVGNASSKYAIFFDDDSIVAPYASFGGVYTFEWLKNRGAKVGIVNLPPYSRSTFPEHISRMSEIGQLDFSKGIFTSKKGNFPEEYLAEEYREKFIPGDFQILMPFQIKNSGGYFITTKEIFLAVGGFPKTPSQRYMDTEFGSRVFEYGYSIYLSPDPKFSCVHGSYGLKNDKKFYGNDWFRKRGGLISLKKAMKICNVPGENTGCRTDVHKVAYSSITSLFWMIYKRDAKAASKWMKKVYDQFVLGGDGQILNMGYYDSPGESERKKIWEEAINDGLKFIENKEMEEIKSINEAIKSIHEEGEISDDIINSISETK